MKYVELEKNCHKILKDCNDSISMAVIGTNATQHLSKAIKGYAYEEKIALNILDTDYNQVDAQILDDSSELYLLSPDFTVLWFCTEKLYEEFCLSNYSHFEFAIQMIDRIEEYWRLIENHCNTKIIQFNFISEDDRVFGNYANKTEDSFIFQIRKLNYLLMEKCILHKNVFIRSSFK